MKIDPAAVDGIIENQEKGRDLFIKLFREVECFTGFLERKHKEIPNENAAKIIAHLKELLVECEEYAKETKAITEYWERTCDRP